MKHLFLPAFVLVLFIEVFAQNVTITPAGITPVTAGSIPRLSYDAISVMPSPQIGDMAFDLTYNCLRVYVEGKWLCSYQNPANYSPNLLAIASAGGTGADGGTSIAIDGSGNVYVTGYFLGTAGFSASSKISAGGSDLFVAKYNSTGTLQWVQTAGGTGDDYGMASTLLLTAAAMYM